MGCNFWWADNRGKVVSSAKVAIKLKYDIQATLLGEGSYSKIFLATLKDDPAKKVAIKCISKK